MADRFNLTAQLQLQAPTNTRQVVNQIRSQLQGISVNVQVQANARAINQVNAGLQNTNRQANNAARSVGFLNKNLSEAARRFGVITLATGTMLSFAQSVKRAVGEAVEFERELIRISQTTGKSVKELSDLSNEVTRLATSLGTSSSSLLQTANILAQAGFSAKTTKQALDILAKTTLGPTFDDVSETVEGAVSVLSQFRQEAIAAGGDIKFLESTLDAINSVSKAFAVESSDLITVIRRTGGVFAAAGGSVNELISLFTSVRATTRESAETIATGLRTIFTRIQRTDTVNQLEQLGISLRDAQGRFVGAFEAVKRLSVGLSSLDPRDYRFSEIIEELGGFRQIGKVIPLIQQFAVAQDALNVAQSASGSVAQDALIAQQSLSVQATKVREEFAALIRTLSNSETFRGLAAGALQLASALIKIGEALEPVLPLLTSLLALKIGQGLAPGLAAIAGFGGARRRAFGGVVRGFADGGYVPGSGNRDTVPAMLTPGEFVIRKSSAQKLGPDTLTAMNENRFAGGGGVRTALAAERKAKLTLSPEKDLVNKGVGILKLAEQQADLDTYAGAFLRPVGSTRNLIGENENLLDSIKNTGSYKAIERATSDATRGSSLAQIKKLTDETIANKYAKKNKYNLIAGGLDGNVSNNLEDTLLNGVVQTIESGVSVLEQQLSITGDLNTARALKQSNIDQTVGNLFESVLTFGGAPYENTRELANAPFDFRSGLGAVASKFNIPNNIPTDAKTTLADDNLKSLMKKVNNQNALEAEMDLDPVLSRLASLLTERGAKAQAKEVESARKVKAFFGGRIGKYANGGNVDTVPSLLTPGEFVINKKSAQSIGYSNLHRMNQTGISKFNTGGIVGVQKFANGGSVSGSTAAVNLQTSTTQSSVAVQKAQQAYADVIQQQTQQAYAIIRANNPSVSAVTALNDARQQIRDKYLAVSLGLAQQARAGDTNAQEQLAKAQANQVNSITRAIRAQDQSIPIQAARRQAEAQVTQAWGTFYKDLQNSSTATKTFSQKLQQNLPTLTSIGGGIASRVSSAVGGREGLQAGAQRLGDIAGAAQQFAFLAGSAAALGSQFGGLNETTSKAISETAAYSASLVGVGGTVVQMFTSLFTSGVQQTASTTSNSVSQQACASATTQNATAQSSAAKAGAGLAQGFAIGALAAVAVSSGFKYLAATAQAEADSLKKAADEQLAAIEKGTGSINTFADSIVQAAQKSSEARALEAGANTALGAGLAGAAGGAAIGAAVGSIIPGIGTAIGAGIGGIVGGLSAALIGGTVSYTSELNAQQSIVARFGAELERSAQGLGALVQAQSQFEQSLQDIETAGLKPEEQVSRRLTAQTDVSGVNQSAFSNAQSSLSKALFELARQTGKSVGELTEADFKKFPALAGIIETSRQTISKATDGLAKDVLESRKTLQEAAKLELTGDVSLDDILRDPTNQLTQALQANITAIQAETQAKITELQKSLLATKSDTGRAAITRQINDEQSRSVTRQRDVTDGLRRQAEESKKAKESLERTRAAQESYRQSLERISAFTNQLVAVNDALNKFESKLTNAAAIREGTSLDFTRQAPAGLSDLSQVGDRNKFNQEVDAIAANLGPTGKELADKVKSTSQAIENGRKKLIGLRFAPDQAIDTNQILKDIGLDPANIPKSQLAKIDEELRKALEDGIDEEEFNRIFGPIIEEGNKAAGALKDANELQNRQVTLYGKYLDELQAQRDKEISVRQQLLDVQAKGAALRARARGSELTPDQSEAFRQARAQTALSGVQVGGAQVKAGDVNAIAQAKSTAQAEREKIAAIKNSTQWEKLSQAEQAKLIAKDKELVNVISKTTAELQRLSDQTEAASEIMGQIEVERAKRETLTNIITDFVVGGAEERQSINNAFAGIQNALSTGTLQGQSPEQRKLTVDMLDKLGDISIPQAGGLTGKQVKQELVFRDAIRMGLDPNIARQLATATSKEEQLIMSLDRLTLTMEQAARQIAAGAGAAPQMPAPQFPSRGGRIQYRANGGSIFKPRGTDTVPAMLTPGEFVIKRSAVDKIGTSTLSAINNGDTSVVGHAKGGVIYRQAGGAVGPANAMFAGQAQNISILSGQQYKNLLKSIIVGIGPYQLAGLFEQQDPQTSASIIKLARAKKFDVNRIKIGDEIGAILDSIISQQGLFESIGGAGFTLKTPNMNDSVKTYKEKLQNITSAISTASSAKGVGSTAASPTRRVDIDKKLLEKAGYSNFFNMIGETQNFLSRVISNLEAQITNNPKATFADISGGGLIAADTRSIKFQQAGLRGEKTDQGLGVLPKPLQEAIDYLRNNAQIYFNTGGSVADTVPAMLTPGEFVMSKSAVQKHGISMMESLNRGQIPGFNKGGLVGGGVQYKDNGGNVNNTQTSIFIDPSKVQNVFNYFLGNFSGVFDNIVKTFSGLQSSFTTLAQSMSNITMEHNVNVEGLISIGGLNIEAIKSELSSSIGQMVAMEVQRNMDEQRKNFRAG